MDFVEVSCFPWLQIRIAPKKVKHEVNVDNTVKESEKLEIADVPYATIGQIESQKCPPEEILSLPMFKVCTFGVWICMDIIKLRTFQELRSLDQQIIS